MLEQTKHFPPPGLPEERTTYRLLGLHESLGHGPQLRDRPKLKLSLSVNDLLGSQFPVHFGPKPMPSPPLSQCVAGQVGRQPPCRVPKPAAAPFRQPQCLDRPPLLASGLPDAIGRTGFRVGDEEAASVGTRPRP
jgi:hypothetical protein